MDVSGILESLNEAQREAVTASPGPLRVLAGAGSGKTRVLVQRIAWLLTLEQASPWSIMAVTFTNKAAREMRERIETVLGLPVNGLWIGTFHGLAHRLLRTHWQEAGLSRTFQILDAEDQQRLLKQVISGLNLDEKKWPARQAAWFINSQKDEGLRAHHVDDQGDLFLRQWLRIYQAYQQACDRGGLVDFGELLLRAHELWRDRAELLAHYRERFEHVLVDEFQDTNTIQYAWLRLLTGGKGDIFVVGDDDQSIYGWRGARIENIQRFSQDFAGTRTIRLEQNYRSTGTILRAANQLIAHNRTRLGKNLWTRDMEGEPISLFVAFNEYDEARFVAERIRQWLGQGGQRHEIAVLYRANAQSRVFEETLISSQIPYRVYGGLRFFDRAEIKDALSYLRLLANRDNDQAFERVLNTPARGIGLRTVEAVRNLALTLDLSLWRAAQRIVSEKRLSTRACKALGAFIDLVNRLDRETRDLPLTEQVDRTVATSGLVQMYRNSKDGRGEDRIENLRELVSAARGFETVPDEFTGIDPLTAFLTQATLEAGEGQTEEWEDCVQLMTLHSAKGLEFPVVFIVGLEEDLFPHYLSSKEPIKLEEERRLAYVGITRTRKQLYLSYAERRRLHGSDSYSRPSRFLREIPPELLRDVRAPIAISLPVSTNTLPGDDTMAGKGLQPGRRVSHPTFGEGVIIGLEGREPHTRIQVNFTRSGAKWLVLAYAKLRLL